MEGLVNHGLIRARSTTHEWIVPDNHDFSAPPDGYVVSFVHFHDHRLAASAHRFLLGLLHYYNIELQHLKSWSPGVPRDRASL
jgi:hypothetical protein